MPISGLTNVPKAFMKIGKIAKGDRNGKNGAPRDLDHFRVVFKESAISKLLEQKFAAVYGTQTRAINVRFPASTPAEIWDANYECYRAGAMIAKAGSNERGLYWIHYRDPKSNEVWIRGGQAVTSAGRDFMAQPIDLETPIYYNSKDEPFYLTPYGRLQCVIPELTRIETDQGQRPVVGFMEFTPHSPIDIRNISAELAMYHDLATSVGRTLNGIPFQLIRRQEEHMVKIDGKMAKKSFWVVHLDMAGAWGRLAFEAAERLALPDGIRYEDVIDADPEIEPEPEPVPAPTPKAEPEKNEPEIVMSLKEARQTVITHVNDKGQNVERFVSELKDKQLEWVIANHKNDPTGVAAARIELAERKAAAEKAKSK